MDESSNSQESKLNTESSNKKQRKLVRSPDVSICDVQKTSLKPSFQEATYSDDLAAMGGGITIPQHFSSGSPKASLMSPTTSSSPNPPTFTEVADFASAMSKSAYTFQSSSIRPSEMYAKTSYNSSINRTNSMKYSSAYSDSYRKPPACPPRTTMPIPINSVYLPISGENIFAPTDSETLTRSLQNFPIGARISNSNDQTTTFIKKSFVGEPISPTPSFMRINQDSKEYYYPLTSPNNPFLPEITAKSYGTGEHDDIIEQRPSPPPPPPRMSSPGIGGANAANRTLTSPTTISSPISTSSKIPESRHPSSPLQQEHGVKKLFTASSPTEPPTPQIQQKLLSLSSPTSSSKKKHQISPQGSKRYRNPFRCGSPNSSSSSSGAGSAVGQQADLNAKREEFLKATMKICLVVSPPSNKLQLKSKSLTHLDSLDSMIACHQQSNTENVQLPSQKQQSEQLDGLSAVLGPTQQQHQQIQTTQMQKNQQQQTNNNSTYNTCTKICCLGSTTPTTSNFSPAASSSINQPGVTNSSGTTILGPIGTTTINLSPSTAIQSTATASGQQHHIKKKSSFMHRKKPLLTRSEVSSSEFFSVHFYTEQGCFEEELIPAVKGISLGDALNTSLRRRNLTFQQVSVLDNNFQNCAEIGSPPYMGSLDENTDAENLAGKVLIVAERDGSKKTGQLHKAASFGSRTRPPRLLSSASTEETTIDLDPKSITGKQLKQRWSGLFGIKNPQQSQLCELLNNYNKNGVPQKFSTLHFDHPDLDNALAYLEKMHKSWRDFVQSPAMTETDIKIQSAIWELVTTEVDYIHALQTVTDLFLACLEAIQDEKLLNDVDHNKLFSNIRDICEANLKFWTCYLYPMVAESVASHQPMRVDAFQHGFISFASTFAPYKKYCAEQSTCQFYCKELNRTNALFTAYLAWCESQKMCNRLRLADILVRPMQRLTKYSLLLGAIRKHISEENDGDIMDSMIHSVENFVFSVNSHLTTRQENERLKGIMARIESYDVVDSINEQLDKFTKQYSSMFDLCSPMKGCGGSHGRHLFMEGDLKFKDNAGKIDVHCFLLTDILLICKTIAKKGQGTLKVIRQPFMTDRLVVKHKDNILYCVYLNEFQMAVSAFTLQCTEAKSWHDGITKAKHIYSRIKQGSNWDGYNLRYSSNNINSTTGNCINNTSSDTLGIKKSPLNSSIGSRVSSLNNSHSGSVELDSRNVSVDFEKTNSLSSDEGSFISSNQMVPTKQKILATSPLKLKNSSSNQLVVQPLSHLRQSLPNLSLHPNSASNLYHTYSNNTLLVPGHASSSSHSGNLLLSPSHRGISYPPPSPTRATLRRGFAFSSIKNPPLVKTRNITSQNSFSWLQQPATPSTPSASPIQPIQTTAAVSSSQLLQHQQQQMQQPQQQGSAVQSSSAGPPESNETDV